jgi:hypothetical protein
MLFIIKVTRYNADMTNMLSRFMYVLYGTTLRASYMEDGALGPGLC